MFNSPNKSIGVIKGLESAPGKNILINGNLTVDQREKSQFGHALPTDEFVYDRWMLVANGRPEIYQIIEDGNYEPNTQYTLSWEGGTTKTVTSPASGHWNMKDSFSVSELPSWSSKKIQLEKGDTATDFELEDVGTTLAKCQRYYEKSGKLAAAGFTETAPTVWCCVCTWNYSAPKRIDQPTINKISGPTGSQNVGTPYAYISFASFESAVIVAEATGTSSGGRTYFKEVEFYSDAEIPA